MSITAERKQELIKEYAASAKDPEGWTNYVQRYVHCDADEYLQRVGGLPAVHKLPLPVF